MIYNAEVSIMMIVNKQAWRKLRRNRSCQELPNGSSLTIAFLVMVVVVVMVMVMVIVMVMVMVMVVRFRVMVNNHPAVKQIPATTVAV